MDTTTQEGNMTTDEMLKKAAQLDEEADNLRIALLAPSMRERTLREEAADLRARAAE